jgi:transcriptional regulator with XRE-family HTH domain
MDEVPLAGSAGAKLKELRERLRLTLRDVEASSRKLAAQKHNPDYIISRGWLNNVENGSFTPSVYKLYSLGAIYHTHWTNIFSFFGLHVSELGRDQALFGLPETQLLPEVSESDDETIVVPLRSRPDLQLDKTNLLSRLVEIWGEIPVRLIQHLDLRKSVYGVIGMNDFTMYPLIRPGSIVQIDGKQRKVLPAKWENEYERPIYFTELRNEYICSWCEIREGHLLAVPYPNSRCEIRRFPYPREAEIIGRVTGVAMRLAESHA